jgi:hypothetical protein
MESILVRPRRKVLSAVYNKLVEFHFTVVNWKIGFWQYDSIIFKRK